MNHTPRPWTISERRIGSEYVITAPGAIIGRICGEANARFVVRACNSHEELLEAAKALLNVIDTKTTDDFARGLEQPEREVLRIAIKAAGG